MNFKSFYLTENKNTHLGYKIVNYDGKQAFSIADNKVKYSLKKGTIETGKIYLGTSEKFATEYYSTESSDPDDPQELLLVYQFNIDDVIKGNIEDKDQLTSGSEIIVKKAKLKSVYNITKKEFITEASQEYNIAKFLSDKIIRQLRDMAYSAKTNPDRYKDTKHKWIGSHEIPMKKFIKDLNIPKGKLFDFLSIMKLYLDYGELDKFSKTPFLKVYGGRKAGGYYEPKGDFGIHIPFIDRTTDLPFTQYFDEFYSTILHELTHAIQDYQGKIGRLSGTSGTTQEEWFSNKNEREAYIHELYRHLQEYISGLFSALKNFRNDTDYSKADYEEYVKTSNKLRLYFDSFETFKKSVRMDANEIFMNNERNKDRFDYITTNQRDVYNKFLEDSYSELKKEFKNVIPTNKLSYTGEKK